MHKNKLNQKSTQPIKMEINREFIKTQHYKKSNQNQIKSLKKVRNSLKI